MRFSLIRTIIISVILFSITVFFQIHFPKLEVVQEILISLAGIGLYFVSELKKLFENLNCIYGLLCQPVVAISFETLSGVDFVKCNKEYFKYWELGKTFSVVCQVLFHQFLTPIFLQRHLIHTYFLLLYLLTHQNVISRAL